MIDRLPNQDTTYYETPDDVIAENDVIETDIRVLGWERKFRIRALTFGQMTRINRNATAQKDDKEKNITVGELLNDEWAFWTIVEGVVRPKFKIEQARRLADNNGEFVKALADEIWNIGRVSKKVWDDYIAEIQKANELAKQEQEKQAAKTRKRKP